MDYYKSAQQLSDQADKARKVKIDFIKQILIMASALLGALLAFYRKPDCFHIAQILFGLALALVVCGILLLSIGLYQEVNIQERLLLKWRE